ncbi:AraC family transcriptional regulator [Anseongella ginsenosidimutans]|uniref:AraC family transcriptional regulator n=1 Tax=Anseongella ginsenosidimutans TaxID=496056 RepID=A0A4R3KT56_9SPHI|nr:AraC family transcriptional regulator [Anseongella ginsenosidimutans]QEC53524.1 helix-turn-helix transcriptional regulator [Anseongella ginsenosidimutans]TCS88426.1 AraC family transcriptional regulator [Anseongella ginsenosidimutans]
MIDAAKIIADHDLELFVKEILVLEEKEGVQESTLPFFADGYPGIVYLQSEKGFLIPRKKALTAFFLYGQMIAPFELLIKAPYLMIVFQLYPFASKLLFDVDPKKLNDDCFDLSSLQGAAVENSLEAVAAAPEIGLQVEIIARFLSGIAREKGMEEYREIQRAIQIVLDLKGVITVNELARHLNATERTLRRKFNDCVGISPKKFAKIIQFQTSLGQITTGGFSKLSDVVYENGYADQSHFIRNIKKFTGKRPLQLKKPQ